MANVYSVTMFSAGPSMTVGTIVSGPVPAGYVWAIREVVAYNQGVLALHLVRGIFVRAPATLAVIAGIQLGQAASFVTYRWEVRTVLQPGQTLDVTTQDTGWSCVVSGFQLALP